MATQTSLTSLLELTHGCANVGHPVSTYLHQLYADTGPDVVWEDLLGVMYDSHRSPCCQGNLIYTLKMLQNNFEHHSEHFKAIQTLTDVKETQIAHSILLLCW